MTTSSRIGSLSLLNDTLGDVRAMQSRLGELQTQISSGFKSKDFAGINGDVEHFAQVQAQIDRATQFGTNNQLNISKLQTADAALSKIYDIADQIKTNIIGANGATVGTSNLPQIVTDLLASMGNQLNTTFNGNYIFGGTDSSKTPVPDTTVPNIVKGVPDDQFYVGAKQDITMRADERTDITFPVRADDIAFQQIYAAAKQAVDAANNKDSVGLQSAQQLIQQGINSLGAARSRVGSTVNNIQAIDDRLKSLKTYWTQLADGISKTDIVAASTQVSGYQAQLQASFQVYARLSELRLSDYLK